MRRKTGCVRVLELVSGGVQRVKQPAQQQRGRAMWSLRENNRMFGETPHAMRRDAEVNPAINKLAG
jgi:hypothetical protein